MDRGRRRHGEPSDRALCPALEDDRRRLGQTLSVRHAAAEYYLSQLVNLTLPFGILGDAGRAVRIRHQAGMLRAGQAVMIERMSGQIALFAVMMAGFAVLPLVEGAVAMPEWVRNIVLSLGLGAGGLVLGLLVARHVTGLVSRAARGFLQPLGRPFWPGTSGQSRSR